MNLRHDVPQEGSFTANTRVFVGLLILSAFGAAQPATAIHFDGLQDSNPTATFDRGYVAAWDLFPTS